MNDNIVYSQSAYVLQQKNYRESSLLIDALTCDAGRISLVAKGVRKAKSKTLGLLRPFNELSLSYVGRAELKTLTDAEIIHANFSLSGLAVYCGYYVNELVFNFLHKYDPHPELYVSYRQCLLGLAQGERIEAVLRNFELNLLESIGYGINIDVAEQNPIANDKKYRFNKDYGFIEDKYGTFEGQQLLAVRQRRFNEIDVLRSAKIMMRTIIDIHLNDKPLKSRSVLNSVMKHL
jgi:DNA repair protein RecO (recombination protein O)